MIINNSNINGYGASNSLNTELNDSLKNLNSQYGSGDSQKQSSGIALSENILNYSNSISVNIKQANEHITVSQVGMNAVSRQMNILNLVNGKLSEAKEGLPNIDSAFTVAKEIQRLLSDLEAIASSSKHDGETILQASSSDSRKHQNLIYQLQSLIVKEQRNIEDDEIKAGNLSDDGLVEGKLSDLKEDGKGSNLFLQKLDAIKAYDERSDIDNSWDSRKELEAYLDEKNTLVNRAMEQLGQIKEFFLEIQSSLDSSIKQMTTNSKVQTEQINISNIDYAKESMEFDKSNILSYAGSFKLSQSNYATKKSMNLI